MKLRRSICCSIQSVLVLWMVFLCRLRKQRQRRRRLRLPMPRRRHAVLRERMVAKLRNSGPCRAVFHFIWVAYHCLCVPRSHRIARKNLSDLCTREAQNVRLCDVWVLVYILSKLLGSTVLALL
jgi:hypothetical protein